MFYPTHRHADGGLYQHMGPQKGKRDITGIWVEGQAYRNEEGEMFWTDNRRWNDRFEPLVQQVSMVTIHDEDENAIASFRFHVQEAGDIRYMLVTAGPLPISDLSREHRDWLKRVLTTQAEAIAAGLHIRDHDFPDLMGDVHAFHAKFNQEYLGKPRQLPDDLHDFRVKFHDEETHEYRDEYPKLCDAIVRKDRRDIINILELQLDALCDAAWVILGTADLQFGRHAFIEAWKRVVKANMAKVKKEIDNPDQVAEDSGRAPKYDIVKPAGWQAPDHRDLVSDNAIFDEIFGEAPPALESNTYNQDAGSYSDTRAI